MSDVPDDKDVPDDSDVPDSSYFVRKLVEEFGLLHVEETGQITSYSRDLDEDAKALMQFLPNKLNATLDFTEKRDYQSILNLWEPVMSNPYFRADLDWSAYPAGLVHVLGARCQIFIAFVQLANRGDAQRTLYRYARAFGILREIVSCEPFKVDEQGVLSDDEVQIQNLNLLDTLDFAKRWLDSCGFGSGVLFRVTDRELEDTYDSVCRRMAELKALTTS